MAVNRGVVIGCVLAAFLGVLGCAGGIGLIIYLGISLTAEPVKAADQFLALVGDGKTKEAYDSGASGFRSGMSAEAFAGAAQQLRLTDYVSSSWHNRSVLNDNATLEGSISIRSSGTISLTIKLVKESGAWRVLSVKVQDAMLDDAAKKVVPSEEECRQLVRTTLLEFDNAVKTKDFTEFHHNAASSLRLTKTAAELQQAFQEFVTRQISIAPIQKLTPTFDPKPSLDAEDHLILKGSYPTRPNQVKFELKYAHENGAWKLVSINVRVGE